jgi:hypothetical protein
MADNAVPTKEEILDAIRKQTEALGRVPRRTEFYQRSGITAYYLEAHFENWSEAVRAAGLSPNLAWARLDDGDLLKDYGEFVRLRRAIPTMNQYRLANRRFSQEVFEKHFGAWSNLPGKFREWAADRSEWADVLALLPVTPQVSVKEVTAVANDESTASLTRHPKLTTSPTFGNPMDFRGLRHEPVNEQGVVFLFGMIARELGYLVEAIQTGYPDCEAKRQVSPGQWQRVRIEFEYESKNFREHGHLVEGCDVIVCWKHNWSACPVDLEVIELSGVIKALAVSEDD